MLNTLLGYQLKNLNRNRSNAPGLDLGDNKSRIAFQVTAATTSEKINHTLRSITDEQLQTYETIVVLGIIRTQRSYTLDQEQCTRCRFSMDNIWDPFTLARKAVDLEIEPLSALVRLVRDNVRRIRAELEVPDEAGKFATSGYDRWEAPTKPKVRDGNAFVAFCREFSGEVDENAEDEMRKDLRRLGRCLARTPRLTREFLTVLYERKEARKTQRSEGDHILLSKVERLYRGNDLRSEIQLLEHEGFLHISDGDPNHLGAPGSSSRSQRQTI